MAFTGGGIGRRTNVLRVPDTLFRIANVVDQDRGETVERSLCRVLPIRRKISASNHGRKGVIQAIKKNYKIDNKLKGDGGNVLHAFSSVIIALLMGIVGVGFVLWQFRCVMNHNQGNDV
ncbi:MAG: hypothetical protein ACU826_04900, partial [Gammaproteobacteria bacterium]